MFWNGLNPIYRIEHSFYYGKTFFLKSLLAFTNKTLFSRTNRRDNIHCPIVTFKQAGNQPLKNFFSQFFEQKISIGHHGACLIDNCHRSKYLGIKVDPHLAFEEHLDVVCRKLWKFGPILARLRKSCNRKTLILFPRSTVVAVFEHRILIYGWTKLGRLRKNEIMQEEILQIIFFKKTYHSIFNICFQI